MKRGRIELKYGLPPIHIKIGLTPESRVRALLVDCYMSEGCFPSFKEMASRLGAEYGAVNSHMQRLAKRGFIVRVAKGCYEPGQSMIEGIERRAHTKQLEDRGIAATLLDEQSALSRMLDEIEEEIDP